MSSADFTPWRVGGQWAVEDVTLTIIFDRDGEFVAYADRPHAEAIVNAVNTAADRSEP